MRRRSTTGGRHGRKLPRMGRPWSAVAADRRVITPLARSAPLRAGTRRPRVVLTSTGTLGDILPLVAVAMRLRAHGLDPVIAAMSDYRAPAEAQGLAFHAVRPGIAELAADGLDQQAVARAVTRDLRAGFDVMLPHIEATLADLATAIAGADLVIAGPLSIAARAMAELHDVPVVTLMLQPMAFRSTLEPPRMREAPFVDRIGRWCGPGSVRLLYRLATVKGRHRLEPLARWRSEHRLPALADPIIDGIEASLAIFAMYPAAFAGLPADAPRQAMSAGFPAYDGCAMGQGASSAALDRFLGAGPPPLVFTLGSFVTHAPGCFYQESAAAARRLGRRAVLLVGDHAVDRFASLADRDVAVVGSAPHSLLFPRAALVVHHGGIGTAAQALAAGLPQLVCPLFGDQFDNAEHLRRLGVARVLKLARYSAIKATPLLDLLTHPAVAARAQALAPVMTIADGPGVVARWVAEHLSTRTVARHRAVRSAA